MRGLHGSNSLMNPIIKLITPPEILPNDLKINYSLRGASATS